MVKTIDFKAVKESLAALDRIAAEHPELLGESTPEEWEETLRSLDLEKYDENTECRKTGKAKTSQE